MESGNQGGVKSARRVLQVVDLLTRHHSGRTFDEIRKDLDLPRSSLHGLLNTMLEAGYLTRGEHGFRLGVRLFEAGQAFLRGLDLASVSRPHLERASARLNETVQLAVLDGIENIYIAKVDGDQRLQLQSKVGSRLPAYATGLGKVLLASLPPEERERRVAQIKFEKFTDRTVGDIDSLRNILAEVAGQGYATDDGEHTEGVFCVAVPVRDHTAQVTAAMSASVPLVRVAQGTKAHMLEVLMEDSAALSEALGCPAVHSSGPPAAT